MKITPEMRLFRRGGLAVVAILLSLKVSAQQSNWVDLMFSNSSDFNAIQQQFYSDWSGQDYVRGNGWKQFHRWENFWEDRLNADGSFPDFRTAYREFKEYKQSHGLAKSGQNSGNWSPLGPFDYTSTQSWSPGLGRVNFIAEDPNNSNIIYIGAPAGGIWKSTNGGSTWAPLGDELAVIGVSSIAISPTNSQIIYISTGDSDGGDTYSIGVMKSTDGGQTWADVGNLGGNLRDILVDPTNPDIAYVCSNNGVYKTTNGGNNWNSVLSGSYRDIEMKPGDAQTVYAASGDQVRYTTNGGTNWSTATGIPTGGGRIALAVTPADNGYVYALRANSGNGFGGIYRSTNSGVSFTPRNTTTDVFDGSNQAWFDLAICASSTNANTIFTGVLNVWKSTDGGSSLNAINSWSNPGGAAYTHADIHFLRYYGGNLYCGSDGGIYRSTNNGSSFTDISDGLQIGQFYRISGSPNDVNTIAGGLQDNGGYVWNNNSWKVYYGADGMEAAVNPTNSNRVYGMIQYGSMYRTTDGGGNLQNLGSPQQGRWVTPMQHDPNVSDRIVAGFDDLYEYSGGWNQLSTFNFPAKIRNIEIYEGNSQIMYVSTSASIYRTTNNGTAFTNVTGNLGTILDGNSITSIEVDPANSDRVWVSISGWSAGNKVAFTSDGGANWTNISGTLPNLPCNIVKYEAGSSQSNAIYIGLDIGVYYRDDACADFVPYMTNLPNVIVRDLEIHEGSGVIRAGTYGRGVWESGLYSVVVPSDDAGVTTIVNPAGTFCGETFTPEVTLRNFGGNALTQVDIRYQIDAGPISTFNWTGNLASFTDVNVTLPSVTQGGTHVFKAWTELPNGAADGNTGNDTSQVTYTGVVGGTMIYATVIEDCWGVETTWQIDDTGGNTVLSGGPYANGNPLLAHTDSVCLQYDCYDFIINDTYGDGIGGSQHNSCNDDGNYYIITEFGDTVVTMPVADFGNQATHNFCLTPPAVADFTLSASPTCVGTTVTFTDASSNATSWVWDFGANATPATATGAGPHDVTYSTGGSKTVTLTVNGNGSTETETVLVNTLPSVPTISASGPTNICAGTSVNLTSSQAIGNTWSTTETSSMISVASSGSYTVTYTDNNGCTASSVPTVVTVNAAPAISMGIANNPTTCATATGSIEVSGTGNGDILWGGTASGSMTNVTLPYTISGLTAGSYNITFTDGNGCVSNTVTQALTDPTPPATPTISVGGSTTFCEGQSVVLTSSANSGNGWTNGAGTNSITVTTSGNYAVTVTDNAGCSASSSPVTVTVNPLPTAPVITVNGVSTMCDGESVDLVSSYGSGNSWSTAETTQTITVNLTGTIDVTHTDANGCSSTSIPVDITVHPNPTVDAGQDQEVCEGANVVLTGSGADNYAWDNGVTDNVGFTPVVGTQTYTVVGTNTTGCEGTDDVTVTVHPLPSVSFGTLTDVCLNDGVVTLSQGAPNGGTYAGPGVTGNQFDPSVAGVGTHSITYTFTDVNGCENDATSTIYVDGCSGINENLLAAIEVFPNPMENELTIQLEGEFTYRLLDARGRLVASGAGVDAVALNTTDHQRGVYMLQLSSQLGTAVVKLIKE